MISRNTLGFWLLFAIAVASAYLERTLKTTDNDVGITDQPITGFYVRSARILGTGVDGRLLYEIEAEYAEHQDNNQVELQNVEINYTTDADVPWTLNADKAVMADDQNHVTLSGHVMAVSDVGFSGDVTEIRTQILRLEPSDFRAETDARVQIRIGVRSLTATGMLAMLQTNELQLKSNVRGKFVP